MLDRFYLIVDHAAWLERLLPHGVRLAQLRVKDRPSAELRAQIVPPEISALPRAPSSSSTTIGDSRSRKAATTSISARATWTTRICRAIRTAGVRLGISTHDDAELDRALACVPDYVALGPIYPTLLKQMPWAPQGLAKLGVWKARIGAIPLVAIGGLTPERARAALAAGADSAAVVTDILRHADPEARAREWRDAVDGHDRPLRAADASCPRSGRPARPELAAARVLVVGAGGLGSPVLAFLAGAGVGHLTIARS